MGWFGPTGICGCCDGDPPPPPPPPPECACPAHGCLPTGKRQFTSVKSVVSIGDGITAVEIRADWNCTSPGACINQQFIRTVTHTLTGLSGANGTYDAAFVKLDSGSTYIDADLEEDVCGYWFFPYIEIPVVNFATDHRTWPSGCTGDTTNTTNGVSYLKINTYTGQIVSQVGVVLVPLYGPTGIPYSNDGTETREFFPFDCGDESYYDIDLTWNASSATTSNTFPTRGFSNAYQPDPLLPPEAGPIGLSQNTSNATYDGQQGIVVPFTASATNGCLIQDWEETITTIAAFSEINPNAGTPAGCSPPKVREMDLSWNEWTRSIKIIFNA